VATEKRQNMLSDGSDPGSFRDPSGHVYRANGAILRQINRRYELNYNSLMASGLYQSLVDAELLVAHEEEPSSEPNADSNIYKVIRPQVVPFISYPYEWCFSQLKDAALTTLKIQEMALNHGMILKDSSAFNIQFVDGKPKLIDTLSFEIYDQTKPWIAYRQFCEHFLSPLALMSYVDVRLNSLFKSHIDGIPLDLTGKLLPAKAWLNLGLSLHVFMHSKADPALNRAADPKTTPFKSESVANRASFSKASMLGMMQGLRDTVQSLNWRRSKSHWVNYYKQTNYTEAAMSQKQALVKVLLERAAPKLLWDLGANTGVFSCLAASLGIYTISMDYDPACVEENYVQARQRSDKLILPIVMDLAQPSPSIGWSNEERTSLAGRGKADTLLALALVHHLAIANNVPLGRIAKYFAGLSKWLIIEFVPKEDSQVQHMLSSREDIFDYYDKVNFEGEFSKYFQIEESRSLDDTSRCIYLMRALDE
jgi:hypothetical protein